MTDTLIPIIVRWCGHTKRIEVQTKWLNKRGVRKAMSNILGIGFVAQFTWEKETN